MSRPPFYRRPGSGPIHPVDANVTSLLARQAKQKAASSARSGAVVTTVVTASASSGGSSSGTYTAAAPLVLTGTAFSIPTATATSDGYLAGADWATFNGKEPALGNPAADGYLLSSTAAGVRSWTAPPVYTLPTASATVLGGVKVGTGLSIAGDGTLSAAGGGGSGAVYSGSSSALANGGSITVTHPGDPSPYSRVPTLVANVPSCQFLCHCDGASGATTFTDAAGRNTITAASNAQVDTGTVEFGTGSVRLNLSGDTGDGLTVGNSDDFNFGSADFTVEFWFNLATLGVGRQFLVDRRGAVDQTGWTILIDFDDHLKALTASGTAWDGILSAGSPSTGAWHHVALVRYGTQMTLYLDGVAVASQTVSSSYAIGSQTQNPTIGYAHTSPGGSTRGYLDEIRVTKGTAVYTASFTPPSAAFTVVSAMVAQSIGAGIKVDYTNTQTIFTNATGGTLDAIALVVFSGGTSEPFSWMKAPLASDWTWLNQSTATMGASANGGFWLRQPAQSSPQITGMIKPQPATPYTVEFGLIPTAFNMPFVGVTIGWYDSGSGRIIGLCPHQRGGSSYNALTRQHWSAVTAFDSDNNFMADGLAWGTIRFVRLSSDGATLSLSVSNDGVNYLPHSTEAVGSYLTPTHLCVGVWTANAGTDSILDFVHYHEH